MLTANQQHLADMIASLRLNVLAMQKWCETMAKVNQWLEMEHIHPDDQAVFREHGLVMVETLDDLKKHTLILAEQLQTASNIAWARSEGQQKSPGE